MNTTLTPGLNSLFRPQQVPLLFLTLFVIVFAHSLQGEFVYDDVRVIQENSFIRDPSNIAKFFSQEYFGGSQEMSYRPVVTLSYFLDFTVFGLKPFGYRLHNLLLHLLACALLWRILWDITKSRGAAWCAMFLFCFHPIGVEAVAVPSMREELQCAVFILASWLALWHGGRWVLAGCAYALALLSKETALFFPLVIVAAILAERRVVDGRRRSQILLSLGVVSTLYIWLRFVGLHNPREYAVSYLGGNIGTSLLTHWSAWTRGVWNLFFPLNLTVDPWLPTQYCLGNVVILSCALVWLFFGLLIGWAWAHDRVMAFGFVWFLGALLPVSGIVPILNVYADRYFYLPMVGLAIATAAWLSKLCPAWYRGWIWTLIIWTGFLCFVSFERVIMFHDNPRMWNDALEKLGSKPWPLNLLSLRAGAQREPLAVLQERTLSEPNNSDAWTRLAAAYVTMGDLTAATRAFQISLQKNPDNPDVHLMMGDAFCAMGCTSDALNSYNRALALKPDYAEAHNNLGVLFMDQKEDGKAQIEFQKVLAIKPDFSAALCNLATLHANHKDYPAAIALWEKVLQIDPYHTAARWNLLRLRRR